MKINTGFKSINKVTVTDIKKNHILAGTVVVSILAYLLMIIIGNGGAERSRWTAYAVFIYIIVLATPLIYYIRYSDKNKRIIEIGLCQVIVGTFFIFLYDHIFILILGISMKPC